MVSGLVQLDATLGRFVNLLAHVKLSVQLLIFVHLLLQRMLTNAAHTELAVGPKDLPILLAVVFHASPRGLDRSHMFKFVQLSRRQVSTLHFYVRICINMCAHMCSARG